MPEYRFRGSVVKRGVTFYLSAPDAKTARMQALEGKYDEYDDFSGETVDWDIDADSIEENT